MLESEENFKRNSITGSELSEADAKAAKLAIFESKAFINENMLKSEAEFASFGGGFMKKNHSKKIMVYEFKDMEKNPTFAVYNFKEGTYSETDDKDFQKETRVKLDEILKAIYQK